MGDDGRQKVFAGHQSHQCDHWLTELQARCGNTVCNDSDHRVAGHPNHVYPDYTPMAVRAQVVFPDAAEEISPETESLISDRSSRVDGTSSQGTVKMAAAGHPSKQQFMYRVSPPKNRRSIKE